MEISRLEKEDETAWNEYANESKNSTFYHQIGWRNVIEKTYGHEPNYIVAKENDIIKGILPLFSMKSRFFGKKLVSVPFAPYCGICADDDIIRNALIAEAVDIVNEKDLDYLEFRDSRNYLNNKFVVNESYVTYLIDLETDFNKNWENIKRDRRRNVEKAIKYGLDIDWNGTIDDFYNIHLHTMRDLGTPTHKIQFFENCIKEFPNDIKVLAVKYNGKLICSQFLFLYKDTIIAAWGSSLDEFKAYYPDQITVWEVIKYGSTKGYKYFDFGRSIYNSGAYKYKERWGGYPKQLYYQYYLNKINIIPDSSQTNIKRQKFARLWRKIPLPIANAFGPKLRRNVP